MNDSNQEICKFCQIVSGEDDDSLVIYEDDKFLAFLDHRPLFAGHSLLLPKQHFPTLYDLPKELVKPFFLLVQRIGKAVERGTDAEGSFIANNNRISQSVPHLHLHIVPRNYQDGLKGFFWPRQKITPEEMKSTQQKIKKALSKIS